MGFVLCLKGPSMKEVAMNMMKPMPSEGTEF